MSLGGQHVAVDVASSRFLSLVLRAACSDIQQDLAGLDICSSRYLQSSLCLSALLSLVYVHFRVQNSPGSGVAAEQHLLPADGLLHSGQHS